MHIVLLTLLIIIVCRKKNTNPSTTAQELKPAMRFLLSPFHDRNTNLVANHPSVPEQGRQHGMHVPAEAQLRSEGDHGAEHFQWDQPRDHANRGIMPKEYCCPSQTGTPRQGSPSAAAPAPQPAAALTSDIRTCIITSKRQQETKCASHAEAERPIVINCSQPCTLSKTKTKTQFSVTGKPKQLVPTVSPKGPTCSRFSLWQHLVRSILTVTKSYRWQQERNSML